MIKRTLVSMVVAIAVTFVLYYFHRFLIDHYSASLSFKLMDTYIFHFVAYFCVVVGLEFTRKVTPDNVGFGYFATIFIKLGAFALIFGSVLFAQESLSMFERLSIVVPLLIFIFMETIHCSRLLRF